MVIIFITGTFTETAIGLHKNHRFKQCVEAHQIIRVIEGVSKGFRHHPAVKMWQDHVEALKDYFNIMLKHAIEIDGVNTTMEYYQVKPYEMPWFMSYMPFIYSHRARLHQKNPAHYPLDFPLEYLTIGYIWTNRHPQETYLSASGFEEISKLADSLNSKYVNAKYCTALLKSGKRKGEECGRLLDDTDFCGTHSVIKLLKCDAIVYSGPRSGEECGAVCKKGSRCGRHSSR